MWHGKSVSILTEDMLEKIPHRIRSGWSENNLYYGTAAISKFFGRSIGQTKVKIKWIIELRKIGFDPNILFVINVLIIEPLKKFNMTVSVKIVCFQIIQNVLYVKSTQISIVHEKLFLETNFIL